MQEKISQVVMLPHLLGKVVSLKDGRNTLPAVQTPPKDGTTESNWKQSNHLYFISDDEIKEGNWLLGFDGIRQAKKSIINSLWVDVTSDERKIVASTDPSLGLPAIPEEWIRNKYVPSNGNIKEVKLEQEMIDWNLHDQDFAGWRLKLTDNNEVIILHSSEDGKIWDEISLGILQPCVLGSKIDKELEDAANKYGDNQFYHRIRFEAFKAGAVWEKERAKRDFEEECRRNAENH